MCVVHGTTVSFFNQAYERIKDVDRQKHLRGATFVGTESDDVVVVKDSAGTGAPQEMVELLQNWRGNQETYTTCTIIPPCNLNHEHRDSTLQQPTSTLLKPHDCWLSRHPVDHDCLLSSHDVDHHVFYLIVSCDADTPPPRQEAVSERKSFFYQSCDNGNTWAALNLNFPLTNHWCAARSGKRLWAVGNRFEKRSVLTGYFLCYGVYEVERFVDEYNAGIKDFLPVHLTVDKSQNLIVVDKLTIHQFNSTGEHIRQIRLLYDNNKLGRPRCIALSHDELKLYVGTWKGNILVFDYNNEQ